MADDLTVALFDGNELRGLGPAPFVREAQPDVVAGHGLGDLAALVAADALDLADALRLAVVREQLLAHASEYTGGGMLELSGEDATDAAARVVERSGAHVSRYDSPLRVALSGTHEQLARARATAAELAIDVADVDAPAALHCAELATTAAVFASMLASVPFRRPALPVYSSLTGEPVADPRAELASCLDSPVRWTETILALEAAGAARFVDAGATRLGDLVCETLSELVHA